MKIDYNVRGEQRKALAAAISQVLQTPAQYKGAPTFSYQIGELFLDKSGKPYIVSFVVNKLTSELSDMDVLHAINTKKKVRPHGCTRRRRSSPVSVPAHGF